MTLLLRQRGDIFASVQHTATVHLWDRDFTVDNSGNWSGGTSIDLSLIRTCCNGYLVGPQHPSTANFLADSIAAELGGKVTERADVPRTDPDEIF